MTETKVVVEKILSSQNQNSASEVLKKPRSVKAQKTAAKVQLMKLKMKSSGDKSVPQSERIYFLVIVTCNPDCRIGISMFQVTPPKSSGKSASGVWISRDWVMGKVIDSLASLLSVHNNNNNQTAPKLKLFRSADGVSVSEDTSLLLDKILASDELFNGDGVTLEYIVN